MRPLREHEVERLVEAVARVLSPGGVLLLTEGSEEWIGSAPDWLGSGVRMRWEVAGRETTLDQLDLAGFEVLDK